jgi:hypothetical protein
MKLRETSVFDSMINFLRFIHFKETTGFVVHKSPTLTTSGGEFELDCFGSEQFGIVRVVC